MTEIAFISFAKNASLQFFVCVPKKLEPRIQKQIWEVLDHLLQTWNRYKALYFVSFNFILIDLSPSPY